ncbi:MAG: hypothetical protein AABY00_01425, partial [Nanoarchaeota archaeon]
LASYREGLRSQGMSAESYLKALSEGRGYRAPERTQGEYKDIEAEKGQMGGGLFTGMVTPLSSLRGIGARN